MPCVEFFRLWAIVFVESTFFCISHNCYVAQSSMVIRKFLIYFSIQSNWYILLFSVSCWRTFLLLYVEILSNYHLQEPEMDDMQDIAMWIIAKNCELKYWMRISRALYNQSLISFNIEMPPQAISPVSARHKSSFLQQHPFYAISGLCILLMKV